ncbi:MAG: hypothetical protein ABSH44_18005 [Bryobacteraceae bacterium]|jgi:hypothetical protein
MTAQKGTLALLAVTVALPMVGDSVTFPHALARRGCTQEDAPALELFLTREAFDGKNEPRKPYLHMEIAWGDFSKLVGKDLDLIPLNRNESDRSKPLVRAEVASEQGAPVWLSGQLRLSRVEVDKRVEGSYQFLAPDQTVWKGQFKARWVAAQQRCG